MIFETLYKKSSTGKILVWFMEQEGDKYRTYSGHQNGKIKQSSYTFAKPKNIGKSNENTAEQQAFNECASKYVKKIKAGYTVDLEAVDDITFIKPMLAKSFEESKVDFSSGNVISQPKLDGVRCVCTKDGMFTRTGNEINSVPFIYEEIKFVFEQNPDMIIDGELYSHEYKDNFNKIISIVRKENPSEEEIELAKQVIKYHTYDVINDLPYSTRFHTLIDLLSDLISVVVVPYDVVDSVNSLSDRHTEYLDMGYEGTMVRIDNTPYENKRSKNLLKLKDFQDEEFEIVELLEGRGNNAHMVAKVSLLTKDGKSFKANMTGSWTDAIGLLEVKDEYVGGEATVKFFSLTPDGIPRFPVIVALYKEKRDS